MGEAHRISSPYKLAGAQLSSGRHGGQVSYGVELGGDEVVRDGGPVFGRIARADFRAGRSGRTRGRKVPARRRVQAAQLAVRFQGMGEEGLKLLREAARQIRAAGGQRSDGDRQIALMLPYVDILQVGARNMQNFNLLRELGKVRKPVLLKRGIAATIEELLLSAEYIMAGGNYDVISVRARHPHL